jgi:GGDEF domain-containing protein
VPGDAFGDDTLLRQADIALYDAKRRGRNTWRLFEPAIDAARFLV